MLSEVFAYTGHMARTVNQPKQPRSRGYGGFMLNLERNEPKIMLAGAGN